jgi:chromosomal replication initiation ATPase DnaA
MERSIAAAQALVAALDARSLATQRPVTRALAAEVLDTTAPE